MMGSIKNIFKKFLKDENGQGVVEYSMISFLLLAAGTVTFPTIVDQFYDAYNIYLGGFFYLLSLPII